MIQRLLLIHLPGCLFSIKENLHEKYVILPPNHESMVSGDGLPEYINPVFLLSVVFDFSMTQDDYLLMEISIEFAA